MHVHRYQSPPPLVPFLPTARITRAIIAKKADKKEAREREREGNSRSTGRGNREMKTLSWSVAACLSVARTQKKRGGGGQRGSEEEGARRWDAPVHRLANKEHDPRAQAELGAPFLEKYFSAVRGTMAFSRNIQGKTAAYMNKLRIGLYACNWQLSGATFLEFSFYDH